MTAYTITNNAAFGSKEITFDGIPSKEIREALKALKFRWHAVKKLWYGFAEESELNRICGGTAEAPQTEAKKESKKADSVNQYGVKVGDIFRSSWGYEETHNDFYQVIALVGSCSVRVRQIHPEIVREEATCSMAANFTYNLYTDKLHPYIEKSHNIKDQENGDLKKISVSKYDGSLRIKINSVQTAYLETEKENTLYESWYA